MKTEPATIRDTRCARCESRRPLPMTAGFCPRCGMPLGVGGNTSSAPDLYRRLEHLRREWTLERQQFRNLDARGRLYSPANDRRNATFATVFGVLVLLFWIGFTIAFDAPILVPAGGGLILLVFLAPLLRGKDQPGSYKAALHRYEFRRDQIIREITRGEPRRL